MRLKVLMDNTAIIDQYYLAEPALSFLLEDDDIRLLFDTGYSSAFLANADAMGEDLSAPDAIVLSHGHDDHTAGLRHWLDRYRPADRPSTPANGTAPDLVAHPRAFQAKSLDGKPIGSPVGLEELGKHFTLRLSATPLPVGKRFVFLGEIPRSNAIEGLEPIGETSTNPSSASTPASAQASTHAPTSFTSTPFAVPAWEPDLLADDSAMVWKGNEGLVILSGCSHAGIVNIVEYAIQVCGDKRIVDIVGGFHLLGAPAKRLDFTSQCLTALRPRSTHPCHCTDLAAKIHLASSLPVNDLGVGMEIEYR